MRSNTGTDRGRPAAVVFFDLRGLSNGTRLHLLARFGRTGDSANVDLQPARAGLDLWNGGTE